MITIDVNSAEPLEDQLCKAIRTAIARGEVGSGDALPSVRQLAADLSIHWNTVARAYRRLQDAGLLSVRRGRGVFVKAVSEREVTDEQARSRVAEIIDTALTEARLSGMSMTVFRSLVLGEIQNWEARVS